MNQFNNEDKWYRHTSQRQNKHKRISPYSCSWPSSVCFILTKAQPGIQILHRYTHPTPERKHTAFVGWIVCITSCLPDFLPWQAMAGELLFALGHEGYISQNRARKKKNSWWVIGLEDEVSHKYYGFVFPFIYFQNVTQSVISQYWSFNISTEKCKCLR